MKRPFLILLAAASPALAQSGDPATAGYRAGISQRALQDATVRLKDELAGLAREYERYGVTALEIEKLQQAAGSLDGISNKDMPALLDQLAAASRQPDPAAARGELAKASAAQSRIQTEMLRLADLLTLHAEQAAMRKRLEDLAVRQTANLRATRAIAEQLAQSGVTPEQLAQGGEELRRAIPNDEQRRQATADFNRRSAEQAALAKEIDLAAGALEKVASDPAAAEAAPFRQAADTARQAALAETARQADATLRTSPATSAGHQQAALDSLTSMVHALEAAASPEDRLRDMATQLAELGTRETAIARRTPTMWGDERMRTAEDQAAIGDRLEVMRDRLTALSPQTAARAAAAATAARNAASHMGQADFRDNAPLLGATADLQSHLNQELRTMDEALQQQADAMSSGGGSASQENAPDPQAAALQDAMQQLSDAHTDLELAARLNANKGDYAPRVAAGLEKLAAAAAKASEAGAVVPKEAHNAIADATKGAGIAATGEKVEHYLHHSRININDAISRLQQAAIELAARQQQQQQQAGSGGSEIHFSPSRKGGPVYQATGSASDARRDALTLLKQEKTAPGFETMVNQYIKNLSDDAPETDR